VPVHRPLVVVVSVLVLAAGCGSSGGADAAPKGRVIEVSMTEMAFSPSSVVVAKGERITFRFVNNGSVVHEAVLGDAAYQVEHEELMRAPATTAKAGGHQDHQHDASTSVTLGPGATGVLTWTAADAGTVLIGCHQPGHYAAGMKAEISVA
jgi:uncharacterized cupredoxin-like copper-binding protein